jgi:hypothetical protein
MSAPLTLPAAVPDAALATAASLDTTREATLHTLLRLAIGLCFIGHGAFGILTKAAWLPYFGLVGMGPEAAHRLMPVVGSVDILIGVAVLTRPHRLLLVWAVFWCVWTAALRPLTGEGIWEMLERAGNYGVPLALLLLGGATHRAWPAAATREKGERLRLVFRTLQGTTALLLVGHGALLAGGKPAFVEHWAAVGVPAAALPWLGGFEILLAGVVLARPGVGVLVFVAVWKLATEALWMGAGAPAWEWIERAGSYAAPAGAALLAAAILSGARSTPTGGVAARRMAAAAALALGALLAPAALHAQPPPPDAALVSALRAGGHVLYCRHAITDHSQQDSNVDFANPLTQRRLSAEGEAQARAIGRAVTSLGIPIADVYASPYDRNMKSAELSFGRPVAERVLLTAGDSVRRRALLAGPIPAGGNRAIVTHERTIHLDVQLPRGAIDEGTCLVLRPDGRGGFNAIARVLPAQWQALRGAR